MASQTNPWHILGSKPGAPLKAVEQNYKVLLALWQNMGKMDMVDVVEGAWLVVSNPMLRAAYEASVGDVPVNPASSTPDAPESPGFPPVTRDATLGDLQPVAATQQTAAPPAQATGPTHRDEPSLDAAPPHLRSRAAFSSPSAVPPHLRVGADRSRSQPAPQPFQAHTHTQPPATPAVQAVPQPSTQTPPAQDPARAESARVFIRGMRPTQDKHAEDITKFQNSLDALHQEIFDIHFVEAYPPQRDGHHYYSHSNFAGLGPQARSTQEADMLQRRVLEQAKEAKIAECQEKYRKSLDDLTALNKRVLQARLYLGELGVEAEFQTAEGAFEAWLAEFTLRTDARREGGSRLREELARARQAQFQQSEVDARARAEFEENAARVIRGDAQNASLDVVMGMHPNGYGRERFDRAGRVGASGRRLTPEEQAYEDRINAEDISGILGGMGRGRGGGRGDANCGGRDGRGDSRGGRGGGRGGSGASTPRRPMTAEDRAYDERVAYLERNIDSLFGPRTPIERGRRGH